jgi:D-3-phosphoglycerate dehydrogenase
MRPVVVVAERIADAGVAALAEVAEVIDAVGASRDELKLHLGRAHGLVVRSATTVDADLLAAAPNLQVVGRAGVGVDNIDLAAATANGILVVNAPHANIVSAAEHAMALLLAQARNVAAADASMRSGAWDRNTYVGVELQGKVLGVLGLGKIGTLVSQRASAFGMRIVAYDPYVTAQRARQLGVELVETPDELFAVADFITVHLPKTPETEGLIDRDAIAKMKDGVRIVNASRGGIVDETALAAGIESGKVGGAGLDVYAAEPPEGSALLALPAAVLTPHLGASTLEAQVRAGTDVADAVAAALRGELVVSAVNVDLGREVADDIQPYLPLVEHLGRVLVALSLGVPESATLEVCGRIAAVETKPLHLAALKGILTGSSDTPISYVNASSIAAQRGVVVAVETDDNAGEYVSTVRLSGSVGDRHVSIAGTVGRRGPTLIEVRKLEIELPIHDHLLLIRNDDVPGVIGRVGSYIGDIGVNIDDMVVGRSAETGEPAMMGIGINRGMTEEEVAGVRDLEGVTGAEYVGLR